MAFFRIATLIITSASTAFIVAVPTSICQNPNTPIMDIDRSVKPGDDFYRYANGDWLKTVTIPAGQQSFDTRAILTEKTSQRVRTEAKMKLPALKLMLQQQLQMNP